MNNTVLRGMWEDIVFNKNETFLRYENHQIKYWSLSKAYQRIQKSLQYIIICSVSHRSNIELYSFFVLSNELEIEIKKNTIFHFPDNPNYRGAPVYQHQIISWFSSLNFGSILERWWFTLNSTGIIKTYMLKMTEHVQLFTLNFRDNSRGNPKSAIQKHAFCWTAALKLKSLLFTWFKFEF